MSTIAKQLVLVLIKEITADKRQRHIAPDYVLMHEINTSISQAINSLAEEGTICLREASVNKHPAYEIPCKRE